VSFVVSSSLTLRDLPPPITLCGRVCLRIAYAFLCVIRINQTAVDGFEFQFRQNLLDGLDSIDEEEELTNIPESSGIFQDS